MKYVYILQSIEFPNKFYTGLTNDLKRRLIEHNQGKTTHSNKYAPWKIKTDIAFSYFHIGLILKITVVFNFINANNGNDDSFEFLWK